VIPGYSFEHLMVITVVVVVITVVGVVGVIVVVVVAVIMDCFYGPLVVLLLILWMMTNS
jgi:hypothetical protein